MIEQGRKNGLPVPRIICDSCGRLISSGRDGLVTWPPNAPEQVRFVHKGPRCDRNKRSRFEELDLWLFHLLRNSGFEVMDVLRRARIEAAFETVGGEW